MPYNLVFFHIYCCLVLEKGISQDNLGPKNQFLSPHLFWPSHTPHCRSATHSVIVATAKQTTASDLLEITYSVSGREVCFAPLPCTGKVKKVEESKLDSLPPFMCSMRISAFLAPLYWRVAVQLLNNKGFLRVYLVSHVRVSISGIREDQGNKPNIF